MTARRIFLGIVGGVIGAVFLLAGALVERGGPRSVRPTVPPALPEAVAPVVTPVPTPPPRSGDAGLLLLVRDDENDGEWEELLLVEDGRVRSFPAPGDVLRTVLPVTDGTRVYFLAGKLQARGERIRLVAVDRTDGGEELISGSTPLVTPRALFASPNGRVIAFYLDSTRGELTELWTVNPENGDKRVSLERLSKNVVGPFWAPDGGFIVRDGEWVLRGSSQRTGVDLLPVRRSWSAVPPGDTMIPSPGGSQVIYVVSAGTNVHAPASEVRVWDLQEGRERVVVRIPAAPVRLLGWSATGALVAVAGTKELSMWEIRKDEQTSVPLGRGVSSIVLSGDGRALAYLRDGQGGARIVLRDLVTHQEVSKVALPFPPQASPISGGGSELRSVYRLLQFVRPESTVAFVGGSSAAALAPENVVRYVMERIREIADAPPGEPVTAERIWFTRTPGAVRVDYRVGTVLWRRLIQVEHAGGYPTNHSILGVFAPAEGEWILTRGVDLPDPRPVLLYEFEPEIGKWVRKDTPEDIQP